MEQEFIKFHLHSFVSVITNSSTVIYVYQDSIKEAKALVKEVLKLMGEDFRDPDDIFFYGVFCDDDRYLEYGNLPEDAPEVVRDWGTPERKESQKRQDDWFNNIKLQIMKGEISQPEWMNDCETSSDYWDPERNLHLIPKKEKYRELGNKMQAFLNSIHADGGRDR